MKNWQSTWEKLPWDIFKYNEYFLDSEVRKQIALGADVNAKNEHGKSLLMFAATDLSAQMLEFLIVQGADVNAKDVKGKTALMYAAELGGIENVQVLLKHGADVNAKDKWGDSALFYAALESNFGIIELLGDEIRKSACRCCQKHAKRQRFVQKMQKIKQKECE